MNKILKSGVLLLGFTLLAGCNQADGDSSHEADKELNDQVMTRELQQSATPEAVLDDLVQGNERYVQNNLTPRDIPAQVKATASGQFPKAVILSCIDSRVPVEMVFDQGIGDVFVARVAGNVENEDVLGSMEYAVGVAGSKLVMVLGHEGCGAVKSAIDQLDVGSENVTHLLAQVEPAIQNVDGTRDAKDKKYVEEVVKANVETTIDGIRNRSQIIKQLETEGEIMIVGSYYSLQDGEVRLLAKSQ